jgi:hypothetical protein
MIVMSEPLERFIGTEETAEAVAGLPLAEHPAKAIGIYTSQKMA